MNIHSEVHAIVPSVEDGRLQNPMLCERGDYVTGYMLDVHTAQEKLYGYK